MPQQMTMATKKAIFGVVDGNGILQTADNYKIVRIKSLVFKYFSEDSILEDYAILRKHYVTSIDLDTMMLTVSL